MKSLPPHKKNKLITLMLIAGNGFLWYLNSKNGRMVNAHINVALIGLLLIVMIIQIDEEKPKDITF